MCGMFGIAGDYDEKSALSALCLLKHRGPDNLDYYCGDGLFIGHNANC